MRSTRLVVLIVTLWGSFAGAVMSGERQGAAVSTDAPPLAWIAEYRVEDARGARAMTLIRTDDVAEVRTEGAPIHIWRRLDDGIELREVDPVAGTMTVYAPGDLRAMQHVPTWSALTAPQPAAGQQLHLCGERQTPAAMAFTDLSTLREIDAIDEGD